MSITSVSIRNFRSILSFDEKVRGLNIFVGQNDAGKSNILRALDLFFNHTKTDGYPLVWDQDYCRFTPKRKGKAEEIAISLEITPPSSFTNRHPVVWKKTWRKLGLHSDELNHSDGEHVSPKNKVNAFVKAMRFDYVPAIKGKGYFQALMAKLHDMLEATVEEKVRAASGAFTDAINANTQGILDEILQRLNLESTIQLPSDLRELFAQLEFTSISTEKRFSLQQRGDGIKVRHIPIVLRWLADQVNHLSAPGRPKSVTVWGYEEPENNLELSRCFELAKEFVEDSDEIQSFVTTHSPAFYSICRESDPIQVSLFLVTNSRETGTTDVKAVVGDDMLSLDGSMGLLALLEPHFKDAEMELAKLRGAVQSLSDTNKPTIFVEGPTDQRLLLEAVHLLCPLQKDLISIRCSPHHGGGHGWVGEQLIAWTYSRPTATAVGLFDKDSEALQTMKAATAKMNIPSSGKKAYGITLVPNDALKACSSRHIKVPFAIEELLPETAWDYAESKGWLENRSNPIALYRYNNRLVAFDENMKVVLPEKHLRRLALKKIAPPHKEEFAEYVCALDEAERRVALDHLRSTLVDCFSKLGLTDELT